MAGTVPTKKAQQSMTRSFSRGKQFLVDLAVLSLAYWASFICHFEFRFDLQWTKLLFFTWPYVVIFQYAVMAALGVPRLSWQFISIPGAAKILGALSASQVVLITLSLAAGAFGGYGRYMAIPVGVLAMDFVAGYLAVTGVRVLRRRLLEEGKRRQRMRKMERPRKRTLLIGAGDAGAMVCKEIDRRPDLGVQLVGFVDDRADKVGTVIQGVKVLGDVASLPDLVHREDIDQAIISIATASGAEIRRISAACEAIGLPVKIIPALYEILDGKVNLSRLREVTIDDLLGRETVKLEATQLSQFTFGKRVLVTGAGGSIGSELCRQVARFAPERLVLVERYENALFQIHSELRKEHPGMVIVPVICDVADARRVEQVFALEKPEVIFHAAAHKHVPMMEWNPGEAIKNNVLGTRIVADAARTHDASHFVMISTDKAVNPTSVMGTTKRVAEIYIQALASRSRTKYVAVRFGNVMGSAGSVIPIFQEQIKKGGPVTVTHPEMERYFMTIPEACQLVMQAASMGEGGEIFVLDMGEPVRIVDLARDLIRLSGFTEEEIDIVFSGVRPGEKLREEFRFDRETMDKTKHPKIYIGKIDSLHYDIVMRRIETLRAVCDTNSREVAVQALSMLVPEVHEPDEESLDALSPLGSFTETLH